MGYILEPEVAGGWGEGTVADTSTHPPIIKRMEYKFDGWSGDDLLTSFPCFIVSERLAKEIESSNLNGYEMAPVEITKSDGFEEFYPNTELPKFKWLQINGIINKNDFAINTELRLVVSEAAFKVLSMFNIKQCDVEEC
ncbi:MAG: hypothetical protein OEZ58_19405 [Gammaproteobacteria bacterium]|nr:hypothetical protein [Gammaproteobacteria bacterium]